MTRALMQVCCLAALVVAAHATAAEFGSKGGPEPANVGAIASLLREAPYDMELLISYGTSKGGSAGHLALAIRDGAYADDIVYSANYYADRSPEHEEHFYIGDLMVRIPKNEYLYWTTSSLDGKASFGLDFGEVYKRSVIGVRVYGVPATEKQALTAFFARINDDYRARARNTDYHDGEIRYDYLRLNCAKTIGMGFKLGAGYRSLEVTSAGLLSGLKVAAATNANIPTEMAMKLLKEWSSRGYGLDVVLYRKYEGSTYVDPHEDEKVAFKDLPNRFPSVLSRDFRKEQGRYEDFDNLFAVYVLYYLGKYSVRVNGESRLLEIEKTKSPMTYPEAAALAARNAESDSENIRRGLPFRRRGTAIGESPDDARLYEFTGEGKRKPDLIRP